MQPQRYSDFSLNISQNLGAERAPLNATIELTLRCPLTCAHCYNNLPMGDREARLAELSYEEHCRILDEITEAGCFWLLYTGGEIFARKDFLDIYTYAKQKGLLITLFTNGTIITPKIADYLTEWRPFSIEITLYGRTRETYEKLTGIPGSYDRCMRGIRLLMERNLPLKLKTVAVSINKHEVWDMKRFVEEELGLEFKFDGMINPRIDCSQSPLATRLKPEEVVALDLEDPKRTAAWTKHTQASIDRTHLWAHSDEVYNCGGGINSFSIDPYGKVSICVLSHFDSYDLRKGSFREGWESFLSEVRHKKRSRLTKCVACGLKEMCGMCPANGELENGDAEAPVDFLCHVAHLRAHAVGLKVPPHGDCEYCEGGENYEDLMRSLAALEEGSTARELASVRSEKSLFLPILTEETAPAGSGGGCASCH
ncbi:radical SAM protein [Acidobacteria bacterium AH-259-A15]|nr:radical SAM protein [Acidobacteria bacterium AH-259-A15]